MSERAYFEQFSGVGIGKAWIFAGLYHNKHDAIEAAGDMKALKVKIEPYAHTRFFVMYTEEYIDD